MRVCNEKKEKIFDLEHTLVSQKKIERIFHRNTKKRFSILNDGMVMYVNERSLFFLFFFSIYFSNRSSFSTTSMHIIISCFVRKRKRERNRARERKEREGKNREEDCSVLSNRRKCPRLLLPRFFWLV